MAKMWYPVIDILECAECGTCIESKKTLVIKIEI